MNTTTVNPTAADQTTVSLARPEAQRGHHAEGSAGGRQHGARAVVMAPGAWPLLSTSIIARLPLAMLSLVLLVHTERVTGSFALAGLVTGSYTVGLGVGAPVLGRLVDRCGQLAVLVATAFGSSVLLGAVALLPASAPGRCWSRSRPALAWLRRRSVVACVRCCQRFSETQRRCRPRTPSSRRPWS
jgi:hypothetical protein